MNNNEQITEINYGSDWKLYFKIKDVLANIKNIKKNKPDWNYDNEKELNDLKNEYSSLNENDEYVEKFLNYLSQEVAIAKYKKENPTRSLEQDEFYGDLIDFYLYIKGNKKNTHGIWTDNDVAKYNQLKEQYYKFKLNDPDSEDTAIHFTMSQIRGAYESLYQRQIRIMIKQKEMKYKKRNNI